MWQEPLFALAECTLTILKGERPMKWITALIVPALLIAASHARAVATT
jgi:hypothetical protein